MPVKLKKGIWTTMIVAFHDDGRIDFKTIEKITDWLIKKGTDGIFTVCQSTEMHSLLPQEKIDIARCVVEAAEGRVQIVASGHTSDDINMQIEELGNIYETGIDAAVIVSNRLARADEGSDVLIHNFEIITSQLPKVEFGIYECPMPFQRLLTLEELQLLYETGRFNFLKDNCGNTEAHIKRANAFTGKIGLYNAKTETLLDSLRVGYDGFQGIMCNYHVDLYKWFYEHYQEDPESSESFQQWLTWARNQHKNAYPTSAKYHMNLEGIKMSLLSKMRDPKLFKEDIRESIDKMKQEEDSIRLKLNIN